MCCASVSTPLDGPWFHMVAVRPEELMGLKHSAQRPARTEHLGKCQAPPAVTQHLWSCPLNTGHLGRGWQQAGHSGFFKKWAFSSRSSLVDRNGKDPAILSLQVEFISKTGSVPSSQQFIEAKATTRERREQPETVPDTRVSGTPHVTETTPPPSPTNGLPDSESRTRFGPLPFTSCHLNSSWTQSPLSVPGAISLSPGCCHFLPE